MSRSGQIQVSVNTRAVRPRHRVCAHRPLERAPHRHHRLIAYPCDGGQPSGSPTAAPGLVWPPARRASPDRPPRARDLGGPTAPLRPAHSPELLRCRHVRGAITCSARRRSRHRGGCPLRCRSSARVLVRACGCGERQAAPRGADTEGAGSELVVRRGERLPRRQRRGRPVGATSWVTCLRSVGAVWSSTLRWRQRCSATRRLPAAGRR